ncbi:MAG: HAMP domain-containing sensor histidine kinase [Candidatus Eiseniibacteriota bacterium]
MAVTSTAGRLFASLFALVAISLFAAGVTLERHSPGFNLAVWVVLGAVLISVATGTLLLIRRIDRRLESLRASAEAMGSGRPGVRVPVDAHDELAALGRGLNALAARFEGQLEEIRRERDSGEAVLGNLRQGIALLTSDLAIDHANPRFWQIVGVTPPSERARLAAARQPVLEEIAEEAMRTGASLVREISIYVEEGNEYEVSVVPVRGDNGPEAWLLSIEDLRPERKMANLRREFVANASHELKTPLTSIRGYAETLLQGGLEDEENRARFVETIRVQAERLEALVEDLLQLADLERPDAALDVKDWDVSAIVRDLTASFEDLAARRGLRLEADARPGIRARVDRKRIELALRNLIDNAIKYTDAGLVTVRVERTSSAIRVSVNDTGRGIDAEHIPRLFERFYRVEQGRARTLGGTGLGLSIVKHAIQLHGGRVGVDSKVGEGSSFWFEVLPDGPHLRS